MKNPLLRILALPIALIILVLASPTYASPDDLYVSSDSGSIDIYTPPSNTSTQFSSGLSNPRGLAFDGKGSLYQSDSSNQLIYKYTVGMPGSASNYVSGLGSPQGLAFDASGNLFVADSFDKVIYKFTPPDTAKTTFASGFNSPVGIAFDKNGNLFVVDNGDNSIIMITPSGTKSTFASGLNFPQDVAFDSAGNLYVTDGGSDNIYKFAPDGTKTTFASMLLGPFGLAFDSAGNLYEASFGDNTIFKFTPDGTRSTFASGISNPSFLAFEPNTSKLRNISTRGVVGTDDNVLIGGFILGGSGLISNKVVIRAIGPSLTGQGVSGALSDPTLELHNATGDIIASNDNWQDSQATQIQATGLAPTDPHESAILTTLPAGLYTAIVRGSGNTTGVALVELYDVK